jgi:hypothetical protein
VESAKLRGLTELTGRQRKDARPGSQTVYRVPCTVYLRPGPGGRPLALRLSAELGHIAQFASLGEVEQWIEPDQPCLNGSQNSEYNG